MTPLSDVEAEALGRRWQVACGEWWQAWRPGMLWRVTHSHNEGRISDVSPGAVNFRYYMPTGGPGPWPDLRDAATRGAALEVVRERWRGDVWVQGMTCYPPSDGPPLTRHGPVLRWVVGGLHHSDGQRVNGAGPDGFDTEPEALVAALEARQ